MQQRRSTVGDASNRLRPVPKLQQGLAATGMAAVGGASLVEREKILEDMIKQLLAENNGLKSQLETLDNAPDTRPAPVSIDTETTKLEELAEDKKRLEKEMTAVENRIRHLQAENDDMGKEIASYDLKTRKVLEARQKKLDWEKQKQKEIAEAQQTNKLRRIELVEAAKLRDQVISQRREVQGKNSSKLMEDIQADRDIRDKLKEKVAQYEKILAEHRKLKTLKETKEHKHEYGFDDRSRKKELKVKLEQKVKEEAQRLTEIDKRLDKLKVLEQQMLEERKQTMTQKGVLKSQFQDILNRKLDEKEIKDILGREKIARSPLGRSGSMTRLFEVPEEKTSPKAPPTKSKIVGLQSVAGSNKIESSRGSVTGSHISVPSQHKTGKSVEKSFGKEVPVSQFISRDQPNHKSPTPAKDKKPLKLTTKPVVSTLTGTPLAEKRTSIKGNISTPKGSSSARLPLGTLGKKPDPIKPTNGSSKASTLTSSSRLTQKPTNMPLVSKSEATKKSAITGSTAKKEPQPSNTETKDDETASEVKHAEQDSVTVESRVEKIISGQDITPESKPVEEKPQDSETKTSQWEVVESPKQVPEHTPEQIVTEEPILTHQEPIPVAVIDQIEEKVPAFEEKNEITEQPETVKSETIDQSLLKNLEEEPEFIFEDEPQVNNDLPEQNKEEALIKTDEPIVTSVHEEAPKEEVKVPETIELPKEEIVTPAQEVPAPFEPELKAEQPTEKIDPEVPKTVEEQIEAKVEEIVHEVAPQETPEVKPEPVEETPVATEPVSTPEPQPEEITKDETISESIVTEAETAKENLPETKESEKLNKSDEILMDDDEEAGVDINKIIAGTIEKTD